MDVLGFGLRGAEGGQEVGESLGVADGGGEQAVRCLLREAFEDLAVLLFSM